MSDYITIAGLIQFDPRDRQAGGKQVRDVVVRAIGDNKNYSVTIWPENGHITVNKGDVLFVDGKLSQSVGQNKAGEQVTYNNLSAMNIVCIPGNGPQSVSNATDSTAKSSEFEDIFG